MIASRPRVALVIGAGGIKCVAAFGVARVLHQHAIPIDMVVGCSGGAICAAWMAAGGDGSDTEEAAAQFMRNSEMGLGKVAYRQVLGAVFPRWFGFNPHMGILSDTSMNHCLRDFAGDRRFEDLPIPLHMVATDFETGAKVVMSKGPLFDGLRASLAIPLVLPPWQVNGRYLMDGAVCDPLPIDVAIIEGADIIIAVGFESPAVATLTSGLSLIDRFTSVTCNHLLRSQYAFHNLAHHSEVISILPNFGKAVGMRDFHRGPAMLQAGAVAAQREVPYLKRLLAQSSPLVAGATQQPANTLQAA
jgi:NTE family protein